MTSVQHHVVTQTHSTSTHLDNHLDALLDDLQTTVSRPVTALALAAQNGPLINGSFGGQISLPPGASGYREITTTVTREANGVPMTSREYQIEYLNPANTVTVLDDRSSSPSVDILKAGDVAGHQIKSYKTEVYDYKYSKTTSDRKSPGYIGGQRGTDDGTSRVVETITYHQDKPQIQEPGQYLKTEKSERVENTQGEAKVSKNLNELDMLLKELNTPPSNVPGEPRTTPRREHVHSVETRMDRKSGRYSESPSTIPKRSTSATREVTYTERTQNRMNRAQSPVIPSGPSKSPGRSVRHEYNTMESSSHVSRRDSPSTRNRSAEISPNLRRRSPSPSSGEFRPSNFNNYPICPKDLTPTRTVSAKSYSYSTEKRTHASGGFDEPQPYRSPSPVSFPQKRSPSPTKRTLNRNDSGRNVSYQVSPQASENPAVITYKYASHSREQSRYPAAGYEEKNLDGSLSRPFPSSTPVQTGEQNPPKKLDELMASFQDNNVRIPQGGEYGQGSSEYTRKVEYSRESRDRHDGSLQRSPSFERNLRPSNVKVTQSYSQQQQQQQGHEYHNQYQQNEQFQQSQYQQREQYPGTGTYHKEYQRREEHHTREHYPGQQQQYQDQRHREGYQQNQHQQYQQNHGGYQRENREQYQHSQRQYQQNQQYQYQQHQQFQQHSSQKQGNESMASSQSYRTASASKSVAGPPVYYPPGVELFTKKEEAMMSQEQSGGKKKSKGKSKSSSDKGKDKGKGVPVCLPVCCAMPCSIM